jgi:hypothetical protein
MIFLHFTFLKILTAKSQHENTLKALNDYLVGSENLLALASVFWFLQCKFPQLVKQINPYFE